MRPTILHALLLLALSATPARAQTAPDARDPFAAGRWHFETDAVAALEAWNYNNSHEEIYGLNEGISYGIRNGLVVRATQRIAYVSQRAEDALLLGLTVGVRGRIYRRGSLSVFLQVDFGISHTAIATPPRGTRFNYLATGGAGVTVALRPGLYLAPALFVLHISNAQLKGAARNPDLEALGASIGVLLRF